MTAEDYTGRIFGRLTVVRRIYPNKAGPQWQCLCTCGNRKITLSGNLKSGATQSCGCLMKERASAANTTHGQRRKPIYEIWCGMMARCYRKTHKNFDRYGGRGITVCDRWHTFENFYADMGDRPAGLTIDRTENDGIMSWEIADGQRGKNRGQQVYQLPN